MLHQYIREHINLHVSDRRHRHYVRPLPQRHDIHQVLGNTVTRHSIRFGDYGNDRCARLGELACDPLVARANLLVRREAEPDHVHLGKRLAHQVIQALT